MSRRRGRSLGLGYLALIVVLVIILLMITGRLQLQIIPTLNMPELGTPQALLQTPQALLQTPQVLPIPTLPSVIVLPPDAPLPAGPQAAPPAGQAVPPAGAQALGQRTKNSGCVARNGLPDPACTPGAIFPQATKDQICTPGYTKSVRDVSSQLKEDVFASYGITQRGAGEYQVDHLIPLALGGSNDIANLFPEAAEPRPGYEEKDKVENYLHDQVCDGVIPLRQAQIDIATNWVAVYERMPDK